MTTAPEVLSVSELRANLAETMGQVTRPDAAPVFVGRHRRAEAVLVSAARYEKLLVEERRAAVEDAIGSVRAEGLDPSPEGLALLARVVEGSMSFEDATAALVARYQR